MGEIKVTDRRMFTPDGRLREEYEEELAGGGDAQEAAPTELPPSEAPAAEPPAEEPAAEEPPIAPSRPAPGGEPAPAPPAFAPESGPGAPPAKPPTGLLELVQFLGELTLACLGEVPQPDGRLVRDLDAARYYIDLVGSLVERFGPALAPQDRRALESFLDQLRLRYVSRSG